jgi:hypothetical protein
MADSPKCTLCNVNAQVLDLDTPYCAKCYMDNVKSSENPNYRGGGLSKKKVKR